MKSDSNQELIKLIPGHISITGITADLAKLLSLNIIETPPTNQVKNLHFYDSFDMACYQRKQVAIKQGKNFSLISDNELLNNAFLSSGQGDRVAALSVQKQTALSVQLQKVPQFWWQFNQPQLRNTFKKLLDLRALMPIAKISLRQHKLQIQNEDEKTVVYAVLTEIFPGDVSEDSPVFRCVQLQSIKGYDKEYKQVDKVFEKLGAFTPQLSLLDSIYKSLGISTTIFNIKPEIDIDAQTPVRTMTNELIYVMLTKLRLTEPGLIDDIDTEFLHHYRVALRMIRAVITQLKEVYQLNDVVDLKLRFGILAKRTNHLRDLDVFILDKERYLELIPATLRAGLLPLFEDIKSQRKKEFLAVKRWLQSEEYLQEIGTLQDLFVNDFGAAETQWSEAPCIDIAVLKINKRYKKIMRSTEAITAETPDEVIHDLRIECKKLRYLLYFFASLFNQAQLKKVIKQLKGLQDSLGIFNDLSVQVDFLQHYLNQLIKSSSKTQKNIALSASLGGLITTLSERQSQQRETCINELEHFIRPEVQTLFRQTFVITVSATPVEVSKPVASK